jgi:methyl acetate hydrolase
MARFEQPSAINASTDLPGLRRAGSGDWAGLPNCYFWIDRASGVCGAVLTQVLPYYDARIVDAAQRFEAAIYTSIVRRAGEAA